MTEYETLAESSAVYFDACALLKIGVEEDPDSGLVRCLVYLSRIPAYCSMIGFGEFVGVAGKKRSQARIGAAGYLHQCRSLLVDRDMGKLQLVEPVADRFEFIREAEDLLSRHQRLGGGDIWHLMAVRQLSRQHSPATLFSFDEDLVKAAAAERLRAVLGSALDRELLIRELTTRGKWVPA